MLRLTALILLFIGGLQGYGQDRKGYYQAEIGGGVRSEERRVGKECRSRWSPYH